MELPEPIAALLRAHPLPGGFEPSDCFVDCTRALGLAVNVVGIVARTPDGRSVSGSAGERGVVPYRRAFFELFERAAILAAEARDGATLPSAPAGAAWAYARSNGVAAGPDFETACRAARTELVERDRLLRAWYGATRPRRVALPEDAAVAALSSAYQLEAYEFPRSEHDPSELRVVALFGFPNSDEAPLVYGSAAATALELAAERALAEALQRWAFLWGETIPDRQPEFATSADYHQELYLWPAMHGRLRDWLSGAHAIDAPELPPSAHVASPEYVQLGSFPDVFVARAVPARELPLVFGRGHPSAPRHDREPYWVHPIA